MDSKKKIAVIGLACRFPGAENIDEFWKILLEGKDTITHFTDEELEKYEYEFEKLRTNPDFVKARGILNDIDKFDASFFGYTPKEAEGMDPQYRIWIETVWTALENSLCDPYSYKGKIGVFAGGSNSTYLLNNILRYPGAIEKFIRTRGPESFQYMVGNDISCLPSKTAYKLDFRGPAINVQTACSTSLTAIALACNSLINGESDMGVAGGVSISVPQESGYMYQEGAITSPDGCCRSFDKDAKGTVFSNGVGVVVLKRLEDAIRDGDIIYSVIRGWAMNNDGNNKVSYVAPSIDGQSEAIKAAQIKAEVTPDDISYIEAHGTATLLGDPVELTGLLNAFSEKTNRKQYCGIGSVKSNIGHTDVVAGIAGFIKATLSAYHKIIPPTIHYSKPNPFFNFEESPFYVQDKLKIWEEDKPFIAGISSFGIGGTNIHVIIEEPPVQYTVETKPSEWPELVVLSAKNEKSLNRKKQDLISFLKQKPDLNLPDVAYSLLTGRNHMKYRSFLSVSGISPIIDNEVTFTDGKVNDFISNVAFMFPGQGSQYLSMGKELYFSNQEFRSTLDDCFRIIKDESNLDLKSILFEESTNKEAQLRLADTEITQPALFIIEYVLAKTIIEFGINPSYLIGHSIGEFAAACISGVFDLQTAIRIVLKRGKLMQSMPTGEMMAIFASVDKISNIHSAWFEVAGDNASESCTISFKPQNKEKIISLLDENGIQYVPLNTSHAFHSSDFDPILPEFENFVNQFNLNPPQIPFISCLTGHFITNEQAVSGKYWAQQLRNTVRFRTGISTILENEEVAFLEVGPNTHLSSIVKQNHLITNKKAIIATLGKADQVHEKTKIVNALGNLFNIGININHEFIYRGYKPQKITLPTYPFEKTRCWIDFDASMLKMDTSVINTVNEHATIIEEEKNLNDESLSKEEKIRNSVHNIWKSLFGYPEIDHNDDFFDIGGHSLLALQVNNRIKESFKVSISLKEFSENSTIAKISVLILQKLVQAPDNLHNEPDTFIDLVHLPETKNLPLTGNQKRLWLISQIDPDVPSYVIANSLKFSGQLNRNILEQSLEKIFNRHHIVHSVIKEIDGEPYMDIVPSALNIKYFDFSDLPEKDRIKKVYETVEADSKIAFNLNRGPLYRLFLMKAGTSEHYFHFSIHHVIFDGWSWSVFANELSNIYNNLLKGEQDNLESIQFQQYDYAHWEKSSSGLKSQEKSIKFWKENLEGITPMLNFPYDNQRKENLSCKGGSERISLSKELSEKLREISKREDASLFTTLFSLFGIEMQKYTGQNDINVGLPVAYRPHSKLENIFGMFVNTVVVRLKYATGKTFRSLIQVTNEAVLNSIAHQNLPFEKVVEIINPERSFNVNPLFQVAFAWQNNLEKPLTLDGIRSEAVAIQEMSTEFDLTLLLWENNNCVEGSIEYNSDIFNPETITRLKNNFINLAEKLIDNPDKPIESVSMISDEEIEMIRKFNNTATAYPKDKTLGELFEYYASLYPEKEAVVYQQEKLTYKDLNEKANQLARTLRRLGVNANTPVGILVDKSVNMMVGILSILKAGGGYVPIDPEYPEHRINFLIKDSGCQILLTQEKYLKLNYEKITKINLDDSASYDYEKSNLQNLNSSSDLAYIIYTSGTTGNPKGTLIPQKGVIRLVCNTNYVEFNQNSKSILSGTISFDASIIEIWGVLLNGGTLFMINKETLLDLNKLGEVFDKNDITVIATTTPIFAQIAEHKPEILRKLKNLIVGGDVLSSAHVNKILKLNPGIEIINAYGPTENSTISTFYSIKEQVGPNIPIGKPISNSTAYIFDKNLQYQPIGIIGELYVGGDGLSLGYLNRDDLNSKNFIFNPYNPEERLYKTGDLARWLSDGNIEFHGRIDNQIKIRGYRVELEEIETVIGEVEGVVEAVVKPLKDLSGELKLVGFINISEKNHFDSAKIVSLIKTKLPSYMIPPVFKFVSEFKKNVNGKIDRRILNYDWNEFQKNLSTRKEAEILTPTETKLLNIWSDVLKIKDISIRDNFFEIGGNSLLTISIASKIEKTFNIKFEIRNFFSSPSIKDLAELIDIRINLKLNNQVLRPDRLIEGEI